MYLDETGLTYFFLFLLGQSRKEGIGVVFLSKYIYNYKLMCRLSTLCDINCAVACISIKKNNNKDFVEGGGETKIID